MIGEYMDEKRAVAEPMIDPKSPEFAQMIRDIDPTINIERLVDIARQMAEKDFQPLPESASEAAKKARINNLDTVVAWQAGFDLDKIVTVYYNHVRCEITATESFQEHRDRQRKAEHAMVMAHGGEPIVEIPEIDQMKENGFTPLGQAIAEGDLEVVRDLIENQGASPVAKCGQTLPLTLAKQLAQGGIAEYLENFIGKDT